MSKKLRDIFLNKLIDLLSINTEKNEFKNYIYSKSMMISDPKTFNFIT